MCSEVPVNALPPDMSCMFQRLSKWTSVSYGITFFCCWNLPRSLIAITPAGLVEGLRLDSTENDLPGMQLVMDNEELLISKSFTRVRVDARAMWHSPMAN
ncbi:unnamed protein product [Aspergillus oryzae var. brunneus]|uniref:Unnamed protein product n=1 Tax=Aspergillus oryzae var. brunneus TaxID=332754 RepID=A0ABQ6L2K2_ASPOZ|nr:unnamed protein product [Aspergillus oryzae var. brunneus]